MADNTKAKPSLAVEGLTLGLSPDEPAPLTPQALNYLEDSFGKILKGFC